MKKTLFFISSFILVSFLSGCNQPEITNSKIVQNDGIYNYYKGKTNEKIKKVYITTQNGNIIDGQYDGVEFMTTSPALLSEENSLVTIELSNDKKIEKNITFKKRKPIDSYKLFSEKMNLFLSSINENAKTKFPKTMNDGTSIVSNENGVITNINVQDSQVVGMNMSTKGDANQEMASIIVSFQSAYDASNNGVSEAYNNTLESKKENSFSSGGYLFTFSYNGDDLVSDIIKE